MTVSNAVRILVVLTSAAALWLAAPPVPARDLTFEERVAVQEVIERVYYSHQIGATKPFEEAVPRSVLENRVRHSLALEESLAARHAEIGSMDLDREWARIQSRTQWPERLEEVSRALGDDPERIRQGWLKPLLAARRSHEPASLTTDPEATGFGTEPALSAIDSSCLPDDSWTALSQTGAPTPRSGHTVVWTGTLMIVWGGSTATGGRYDPALDSWTPVSTIGAPAGKNGHSAVWTGSEMIVWGGLDAFGNRTNTGGRYDPLLDTWNATSVPPFPPFNIPRANHVAVWTGSRMLVWGGNKQGDQEICETYYTNTGLSYDPVANTWTGLSTTGAPRAVDRPTAIWTGTEMIVFGGYAQYTFSPPLNCRDSYSNDGGRYNPATGAWSPLPSAGKPSPRSRHGAVWTGAEMIVWGGQYRGGGLIDPTIVLGDGARFNPTAGTWAGMSPGPEARTNHAMVWAPPRMIVWGGSGLATGARYDPAADTWSATTMANAPTPRATPGVWTSSRMIVWGGGSSSDGASYDPGSTDADNDALPDSCDPCPADHINDSDGDGFCGNVDNCPLAANPGQDDQDNDGAGDVCDNCPGLANPDQSDADHDGSGDVCDICPLDMANDADHDGVCGNGDNCPLKSNPSQTDTDADSFGDACDNCPDVSNQTQWDIDLDGVGDSCDNCIGDINPLQRDSDGDGKGDLCDKCPGVSDANQSDADNDGEGDACDCQIQDGSDRRPAEPKLTVTRTGSSTAVLDWTATSYGADGWSITRGALASLSVNYGACQAEGLTALSWQDAALPPPGGGYGYLVQGQNFECGLGPLTHDSTEREKTNGNAAACAGKPHTDTHASSETTVFGTRTLNYPATLTSNDVVESVREVLGPGSISRLEHRWSLNVPAGSRIEFHVEGYRTNSPDGDDFRFEYSTNGGSTFTPITTSTLLPLGDNDSDGQASMPASVSGVVLVRVVDTDRTAGHVDLDTVSIDELWIRSVP